MLIYKHLKYENFYNIRPLSFKTVHVIQPYQHYLVNRKK